MGWEKYYNDGPDRNSNSDPLNLLSGALLTELTAWSWYTNWFGHHTCNRDIITEYGSVLIMNDDLS